MRSIEVPTFNQQLQDYIEASRVNFNTCIDKVNHPVKVDYPDTEVDLYYVKMDPTNAEPKFKILAQILAKHVVRYTLSAQTRRDMKKNIDNLDEGDLLIKARDYFRKIQDSGETGELLLFFLLEAALGAPQVVCKMELKTNPRDEVKGADGIHIKWDNKDRHLDVYIGEAKLHQGISSALVDVFNSLTKFYDDGQLDDELHLVTSHFKHLDKNLKASVIDFLNRETSEGEVHIIHACLIGWDWNHYKTLIAKERRDFMLTFTEQYKQYAPNIEKMLNKRFGTFTHKHLTFRFLFLPFKSVSEFRKAFYKVLLGVDIEKRNT